MKKRRWLAAAAVCLLLSGCGWLDGRYVSVTDHQTQLANEPGEVPSAANYGQLVVALENIVASGAESAAINVSDYPEDMVERGANSAAKHVMTYDPIAAYAVEDIVCELGTNLGQPALAVSVRYYHNKTEIQRIRTVKDTAEAETVIAQALEGFEAGIVLLVEDYQERDYTQMVLDYALENPQIVMETPQITEAVYGKDVSRVVELVFTYQNSRDSLRRMLTQVKPVFDSAALYVSGDDADRQKFSQLYAFLMERFDYKLETSITPAYSLLRHGVGDSRAFASVYAAMCRSAGLDCQVVTGTHGGEPWSWNIVMDNGVYYHVDLLRSMEEGGFREFLDREMGEYVWDYSAYPACVGYSSSVPTHETAPETETGSTTEETAEKN